MKESDKKKGVLGAQDFSKLKNIKCDILRDPIFVGLDPSYNGFAIIVIDKDANIIEQKLINTKSDTEVEDRLLEVESEIKFIPNIMCLHSVCIEGPSYSSNGGFVLQMGALHYLVRLMLKKNGIKYNVIAPGTLKKFVAGTGRAKKDLMLLRVYKKWGVEFEDDNLADAYGLARMALEKYLDENTK